MCLGRISIHPPRAGWDNLIAADTRQPNHFNPPTPCGVGLAMPEHHGQRHHISIHPPRAGWDRMRRSAIHAGIVFQSTHPVRGGTEIAAFKATMPKFQSTHPVRGGTRRHRRGLPHAGISIHPPRAGWDCRDWTPPEDLTISIHPPRAGWDIMVGDEMRRVKEFQSTHPVRGGTRIADKGVEVTSISIHPPRAGWDDNDIAKVIQALEISIHPPRAGWDAAAAFRGPWSAYFNPPTPCGVGPQTASTRPRSPWISIHPPRAGWDSRRAFHLQLTANFNPPTPCGVGRVAVLGQRADVAISIHPPRAGWDFIAIRCVAFVYQFQSTHPVRGGTEIALNSPSDFLFQSTHPVRGGTWASTSRLFSKGDFNPPTPCGVGRQPVGRVTFSTEFQSTHPVRGGTPRGRAG